MFRTIFRLAIPAFFRFSDVTEFMIGIAMYLFSFLTKKNIGILELQYKKLYKMERETVTYNIRKKRKIRIIRRIIRS